MDAYHSGFLTALVNGASFVFTYCKQFVSHHWLLKEILNNSRPLFLLLCCSPRLDRETTCRKLLVNVQLFSECQPFVLILSYSTSPLPSLFQWPILCCCTRSILLPIGMSRPTAQHQASPASLSPVCPLLPHYRWRLSLSAQSSLQKPCWLRSLSWVDRMTSSRPNFTRLRALGQ